MSKLISGNYGGHATSATEGGNGPRFINFPKHVKFRSYIHPHQSGRDNNQFDIPQLYYASCSEFSSRLGKEKNYSNFCLKGDGARGRKRGDGERGGHRSDGANAGGGNSGPDGWDGRNGGDPGGGTSSVNGVDGGTVKVVVKEDDCDLLLALPRPIVSGGTGGLAGKHGHEGARGIGGGGGDSWQSMS